MSAPGLSQADCDRLHYRKNKPPLPAIDGVELTFPPYVYQPFPCAMYHATDPASPKLVGDESEKRNLLSRGWRDTPDAAESAERQREEDHMTDAAVRAYDDRLMSAQAKAEVEAYAAAHDQEVVDLPVPPKKRGRPRNPETPIPA